MLGPERFIFEEIERNLLASAQRQIQDEDAVFPGNAFYVERVAARLESLYRELGKKIIELLNKK